MARRALVRSGGVWPARPVSAWNGEPSHGLSRRGRQGSAGEVFHVPVWRGMSLSVEVWQALGGGFGRPSHFRQSLRHSGFLTKICKRAPSASLAPLDVRLIIGDFYARRRRTAPDAIPDQNSPHKGTEGLRERGSIFRREPHSCSLVIGGRLACFVALIVG